MKNYKLALVLTTAILLSCLLVGCGDGIPVEQYERIAAQLGASESQIVELQNEIERLKQRYEITGETPVETAENIVKHYHDTHLYSEPDFYVCADMALDVWDMLKAQGIDAIIKVGNVETGAKDITEVNHAWVLAETTPGKYLALETTAGYAVWDNTLYYEGWSFDNPREYKRFVELKHELDIRINLIKQLDQTFESVRKTALDAANEYTELINEVSGMSLLDPSLGYSLVELILKAKECGEYIGRADQLNELMTQQEQELENIVSEMMGIFD